MKDSGSFFIIILQRNVKEMSLADGVKSNRKPRTINGHFLQVYLEYVLFVFKTDSDSKILKMIFRFWQLILAEFISYLGGHGYIILLL